ncbi:MAG TPA: DUF892 family protein [Solirubrobacterales bacterium]|nr:DUF892 family protein [Solirubrobacterales bacterium]
MLERFRTHAESYEYKLGAALKTERSVLEILELGIRNSSHAGVKELLSAHLEDSRAHVERLEGIFLLFGWEVADSPCPAMEALEKECKSAIKRAEPPLVDAIVLQIALEAEHLEVGAYENLIIHANAMERADVVERLQPSLSSDQQALDNVKTMLAEVLGAEPVRGTGSM